MHPREATLLAFCDEESGAGRSRRIARHLLKCERCGHQLRRIQSEKDELAGNAATPPIGRQDLAGVLSAIEAWQGSQTGMAASQLKNRLRFQIETFFGAPAALMAERPGIRAEELLGKTSQLFDVFLGPNAAEAVRDDALRGLNCVGPARHTSHDTFRETWG